jgi:hypothetical protein
MNKEYIRINNQPFSILSLLRFVTVLAGRPACGGWRIVRQTRLEERALQHP